MNPQCEERVYSGGAWDMLRGHRCSRMAKVERDGKWFCVTHDPVRKQRLREEKETAWSAQRARESADHAKAVLAISRMGVGRHYDGGAHVLLTVEEAQKLADRLDGIGPVIAFDFKRHLSEQHEWSERTFGPGERTQGLIDHITKELREIEQEPYDLDEWIDVVILALDGAWRIGATPEEIIEALHGKQQRNMKRQWPDWRTAEPGKAIEHIGEEL